MAIIRWCPIYPKWDSYQPLNTPIPILNTSQMVPMWKFPETMVSNGVFFLGWDYSSKAWCLKWDLFILGWAIARWSWELERYGEHTENWRDFLGSYLLSKPTGKCTLNESNESWEVEATIAVDYAKNKRPCTVEHISKKQQFLLNDKEVILQEVVWGTPARKSFDQSKQSWDWEMMKSFLLPLTKLLYIAIVSPSLPLSIFQLYPIIFIIDHHH